MKLRHLAPWVETTGGIETLLRWHAAQDAKHGFEARQIAFFDRSPGEPRPGVERLGFSAVTTPRAMRRRLADACVRHGPAMVVHHGPWGVPWFADIDGSERRLLFFHDTINRHRDLLPAVAGLVDGVMCSSMSSARAVAEALPGIGPERVAAPHYPIEIPAEPELERTRQAEWVVGHAGRVVRGHKAAHRLVPFVHEARRLGAKFCLEIMGDGPLRPDLERQFAGDPAVRFLGWQDGDAYWRRLRTWDFIVSFSDHEGGPITMLEGMAAGAIPLYPRIGGGLGDDYVPQVDARCYYPRGDPQAAAAAFAHLQNSPPMLIAELRGRARAAVKAHDRADYVGEFAAFVRRIAALPRISRPPQGDRPARFADHLPIAAIARWHASALLR